MAINFPSNPIDGQQYTNPTTGVVYTFSNSELSWIVSISSYNGYTGSIGYTGSAGAGSMSKTFFYSTIIGG